MKATHIGTCQICGREQKLPGGLLSKHGYTVDHGFFHGVCAGAHGKPFEQSTDLIEGVIKDLESSRRMRLSEAADVVDLTDTVWVRIYRNSEHQWREVDVNDLDVEFCGENDEYARVTYKCDGMRRSHELGGYYSGPTVQEKIKAENEKRAKALLKEAQAMADYIEWQRDRLANWKSQELTPV